MSLNLRCLGALFLLLTVSTGVDSAAAGGATPALIFVVRRGWHIDIGFAASEMAEPLQSLAAEFPKVKYLLFGFGDRRYLLAKNRNAPVLLAAMWPGKGMILDTGLAASPTDAFGADNVIALSVSVQQARDAQEFIWQSLSKEAAGSSNGVKSYATGPYQGSLYYSATPHYSAFHTCNTWAAEALQIAGLPIRARGVIFAGQLWRQVKRAAQKQSAIAGAMADVHIMSNRYLVQQGGLVPSWQITVVP